MGADRKYFTVEEVEDGGWIIRDNSPANAYKTSRIWTAETREAMVKKIDELSNRQQEDGQEAA